jgi:hypothetical protein
MLARIKGGPRVIAGLIENRFWNGIGKNLERYDELDHKKIQRKIERNLSLIIF